MEKGHCAVQALLHAALHVTVTECAKKTVHMLLVT